MDLLINDLGPPPYQITVFESLLRDGQAILERVQDPNVDDVPDSEITKAIERLEALASICFRAMEMDFITYTMDYSTNSMDALAGVLWGLKQQLLRPRSGQGVGQVEGADGSVCRFCGWALERIGVGVGGTFLSSHPDTQCLLSMLNIIQQNTSGPSVNTLRGLQIATWLRLIPGRTFRGWRHHPRMGVVFAAC